MEGNPESIIILNIGLQNHYPNISTKSMDVPVSSLEFQC